MARKNVSDFSFKRKCQGNKNSSLKKTPEMFEMKTIPDKFIKKHPKNKNSIANSGNYQVENDEKLVNNQNIETANFNKDFQSNEFFQQSTDLPSQPNQSCNIL